MDFASIIIFSIAFTYIKSNNNFIFQTLISFLSILVFKILTVVVVLASSSYAISITVWTIFHILVKRGIKLKAEELEIFDQKFQYSEKEKIYGYIYKIVIFLNPKI